jgi:hypothetical protein
MAGCDTSAGPDNEPPPNGIEITKPNGGESYKVGETMVIEWRIDTSKVKNAVYIDLSMNNGLTYAALFPDPNSAPILGDATYYTGDRGRYEWVIPATIDDLSGYTVSTVSDTCLLKIEEAYSSGANQEIYKDVTDAVFSISAN